MAPELLSIRQNHGRQMVGGEGSEAIRTYLSIGTVEVHAACGGLHVSGLYLPQFGGPDDSIEVAVAKVEVEIPERSAVPN